MPELPVVEPVEVLSEDADVPALPMLPEADSPEVPEPDPMLMRSLPLPPLEPWPLLEPWPMPLRLLLCPRPLRQLLNSSENFL